MIAYRQAREKLIERVATFTTDSPIGPLQGYAYRSPFDEIAHVAFVYNGIGDGKNVLTRLHKPNIVKDLFTGQARMQIVLEPFPRRPAMAACCSGIWRDGAAGGFPSNRSANRIGGSRSRNRQRREVGVGAQISARPRHYFFDPPPDVVGTRSARELSGFGIEIVLRTKSWKRIAACHSGRIARTRIRDPGSLRAPE